MTAISTRPMLDRPAKLTREQMESLVREVNGTSALLVAVENGQADMETALEVINHHHNRIRQRIKRFGCGLLEAVFG